MSVVIIGAGQGAAVAARNLRRKGYTEPITVIGDEPELPYQRPPLSKEYLADGDPAVLPLLDRAWAEKNDVVVRTGVRAERIDAADRHVVLADGTRLPAEHVILATGGRPRLLPGAPPGPRTHYLRTRADADALRAQLVDGARVIVIGAGFIGSEVASTARSLGCTVTVLEAAPQPLARAATPEVADAISGLHAAHDVELVTGVAVTAVHEDEAGVKVETSDGVHEADLVVVGIGLVPNVEVAEASGIACENGVLVDQSLRTSLPNVYAIGDVANHDHPRYGRVRVEHVDTASRHASAVAAAILGRHIVFAEPHWAYSDQYETNLQFIGHHRQGDSLVIRGDLKDPVWSAFYLQDGAVSAAVVRDNPEDVMVARELIERELTISAEQLADTDTDLLELLEEL